MKKIIIIALATIAILYTILLLVGFFTKRKIEQRFPVGEVSSPSGRLVCSHAAHMEYNKVSVLIANTGIGLNSTLESAEDVDRLLAAFDALALEGPETVFVAAHIPTGNTYTYTCEEERCTGGEFARARAECGEATLGVDLGNYCIHLAVRFREQDHCLIAPFQGEQ